MLTGILAGIALAIAFAVGHEALAQEAEVFCDVEIREIDVGTDTEIVRWNLRGVRCVPERDGFYQVGIQVSKFGGFGANIRLAMDARPAGAAN